MFEAKLAKASLLKKVVLAIKDLVNDAPFDFTDNSIALQAMDSSHVALVSLKMEAHGFEEYRCDRNLNVGINLQHMQKILACAGNDDSVVLNAPDDGENDTISFKFDSPNNDRTCDFSIKLMDLDTEQLGIPEQEYDVQVKMPSSEFRKICGDMLTMGDTMTITSTKREVMFSAKGDMGNGAVRLQQGAQLTEGSPAVEITQKDPVSVQFAIKYLKMFTAASTLSDTVVLSLSRDVPIVVEYAIEDMGHIRFYLAPKIEEEESQ